MRPSPEGSADGLFVALQSREEQLVERLVTAIALGEYVPGQRLPSQRGMASIAGVSRQTVRTALHRLEQEGYVEIRKGRAGGAYVRSSWGRSSQKMVSSILLPRWEMFEDLFELRRAVDAMVARKAAERSNENDVAAIRRGVEAYRVADGRAASREADRALHQAIAAAARNPALANVSAGLRAEVTLGFDAVPWSEDIRRRALLDHDVFLRTISDHDVEGAGEIAVRHLELTESALRALRDRVAT